MAEAPRKIQFGDAEFDYVYDKWIYNGRPFTFDAFGSFGGAIIHAHDRNAGCTGTDYPTFFIVASAGPTVFDDDSAGGPTQRGWIEKVPEVKRVSVHTSFTGKMSIRYEDLPRETITLA